MDSTLSSNESALNSLCGSLSSKSGNAWVVRRACEEFTSDRDCWVICVSHIDGGGSESNIYEDYLFHLLLIGLRLKL